MIAMVAKKQFCFEGEAAEGFVLGCLTERRKFEGTTTLLWLRENVLHFGSAETTFPQLEVALLNLAEDGLVSIEGGLDKPDTCRIRLC